MEDLIPIAQAIAGAGCFVAPLLWRLASRLQGMESDQKSRAVEVKDKLDGIEDDINSLKESQEKGHAVEREGRKELWKELSQIRERMVKIETKLNGAA